MVVCACNQSILRPEVVANDDMIRSRHAFLSMSSSDLPLLIDPVTWPAIARGCGLRKGLVRCRTRARTHRRCCADQDSAPNAAAHASSLAERISSVGAPGLASLCVFVGDGRRRGSAPQVPSRHQLRLLLGVDGEHRSCPHNRRLPALGGGERLVAFAQMRECCLAHRRMGVGRERTPNPHRASPPHARRDGA